MPADLLDAITHARTIVTWHEHLTEEDMPPRWMWHLPDELDDHFERLKDARRSDNSDDDDTGPMLQNEYARGRGRPTR
jgi:hypothetical protein